MTIDSRNSLGTVTTHVSPSKEEDMQRTGLCFVTEIDIERRLGGAITNDIKTLNCLRKLGAVDSIYLRTQKYRSAWLAFPVLICQILRSSSKRYKAYFSRGLFASLALILLKPIHKTKVIHNALSVPFPSVEARFAKRNKLSGFVWFSLMRFMEKVVISKADLIVVAADSYANELFLNGVQKDKVQTVPFYVEDEFFRQPIKSSANDTFVFCYVGGFHPYHLLTPVIEAFEDLSRKRDNVELSLVGEGPLLRDIENEVTERRLERKIKFLGRLPHSSIPYYLSRVDSFIVLMHKPGMSTSLLEAAAAGKAIITLKRSQDVTLERYFKHLKEILYVEDTSPQAIVEAMMLVCENPEVRNTLSHGARVIAKQFFSQEVCLNQLRSLIKRVGSPPVPRLP